MDSASLVLIAAGLGGYVLGAVPFGIVIARVFALGDLRQIGSGNIGATNVLRTGNKLAAALTLFLDSGKGAIAVGITYALSSDPTAMLVAGFWAVMGHNFPVWLKFRGGKGVATTLGVLLATSWPVGLAACVTWLLVAVVFRYSSLAALLALGAAPVFSWFLATPHHAVLSGLLGVLAWLRHRENIRRLLTGEETKIGKKKKT